MGELTTCLIGDNESSLRLSKRILEYFDRFIKEHILKPLNIIVNAGYDVRLAFILQADGEGVATDVHISARYQHTGNCRTAYIMIPAGKIKEDAHVSLKAAELFYAGITCYFTRYF